jgi:trans-aconitate methyltransferase
LLVDEIRTKTTSDLYDGTVSENFYEERYAHGYMDEWPAEKKQQVLEVIRKLPLPERGEALDFGCGQGVLTDVIREALPLWKIYGTDLSTNAVDSAKLRYPECHFFVSDESNYTSKKYDFLFTNHVIEHVYNIDHALDAMTAYLKAESSMLHFLPCGNAGSFEHSVCLLRRDGIDSELGNRFFFEDEGHLRRLKTQELDNMCKNRGFELKREYYSNHYHGAIEWITGGSLGFIAMFTDMRQATDSAARRQLILLRLKLTAFGLLRVPVRNVRRLRAGKNRRFTETALLVLLLPFFHLSRCFENYLKKAARNEWVSQNLNRHGSEMCLYFERKV